MTWFKNVAILLFFTGLPLSGMLSTLFFIEGLSTYFQQTGTLMAGILLIAIGGPLVGLAVLPSFFLGAMLGYFLNLPTALFCSALAIFIATYLGVFLGRFFGSGLLQDVVSLRPSWKKAWQNFSAQKSNTPKVSLTAIRLAPQMPFALTNLLCAGWPLRQKQIVFYSWVGLLPRTFFAVVIANSANSLRSTLERKSTVLEFTISILIVSVVLLTIYFANKRASARIVAEIEGS